MTQEENIKVTRVLVTYDIGLRYKLMSYGVKRYPTVSDGVLVTYVSRGVFSPMLP